MERYIEGITKKIVEVAKNENKELMQISNNDLNSELGVFHMPELAFAYECGKQIMQNANNIFGENIPQWCRELNLGNGGPSDLVFIFNDGYKIVIEFKMINDKYAYRKDLEKLSELDGKVYKIFCALIDINKKELDNDNIIDGRVMDINQYITKNLYKTKILKDNLFKTNHSRTHMYCYVGIWQLINEK
jgi:hypothetical protein